MASFILMPLDDAADGSIWEARGGDFALSEIPHPDCGLYLVCKGRCF